jgi:hypothetical protein
LKDEPMRTRLAPLLATLLALCAAPSRGDDHGPSAPLLPAYQQECSGCHVAFPPGLLPAASWQRLMDTLPRHFGSDASLEPAQRLSIGAYLQAHAGSGRRAAEPPQDRITLGPWFLREHREVAPDVWARAAVKRASNCGACHTQAEAGRYGERDILIPR